MNVEFKLDCNATAWKEGYAAGYAGLQSNSPYTKGTSDNYNWFDGWMTGDAEQDYNDGEFNEQSF